jgi:membrane protease subunit HflC
MIKIAIAVIVGLIVLSQTAFVVTEPEQSLVLQFGKPVRTIRNPGLYFKYPFIQDRKTFEKRVLVADARPQEYLTLDKKRLNVDTVSRWRVADPLVFYMTVRDYRGAVDRLSESIGGLLRQEIASHNFRDFVRAERENIMKLVTKGTREATKWFGIAVVDVRIKRIDLPEAVQNSVFARMKAERGRIAKQYRAEGEEAARKIRGDADRQREVLLAEAYERSQTLRGEGDARAAAIYAAAYRENEEFYSFFKHLEVYEKIFGPDTTLLLRSDSPLMRFVDSPFGEKKSHASPSR